MFEERGYALALVGHTSNLLSRNRFGGLALLPHSFSKLHPHLNTRSTLASTKIRDSQLLIDLDYCAAFLSPIASSQSLLSCSSSGRRGEVGRLRVPLLGSKHLFNGVGCFMMRRILLCLAALLFVLPA